MKNKRQVERCDFCSGKVIEKRIVVDFHYKGSLVIIENVPVKVCIECGEKYYDAKIWAEIEKVASSSINIKREIKVPVKEFNLAGA